MTDPPAVRVRPATSADADPPARVYRSAYREARDLGFPMKAESATADEVATWIRGSRVYVATVDDEIVGGVRLETTDENCIKLSRLGVHDDWKGQGIGSRLVDAVELEARDRGAVAVRLTTPEDHPYLPQFYRQRGYEETGPYPLDYREYDEVVLEKQL